MTSVWKGQAAEVKGSDEAVRRISSSRLRLRSEHFSAVENSREVTRPAESSGASCYGVQPLTGE